MSAEQEEIQLSRNQKAAQSAEIERLTRKFLANGGQIEVVENDAQPLVSWDGVWLDHVAAAKKLGVPVSQLKNSVMNGALASCPAPISHIRGGRRQWPEAVIDAWIVKYGHHVKAKTRAFREGKKGEVAA